MKEYNNLTNYQQEDFLEYEIMKYLHKVSQTTTRTQLAKYLVENVDSIPKDALKSKKSRKTGRYYQPFMNRLSFALTSLYKAGLMIILSGELRFYQKPVKVLILMMRSAFMNW